MPGDPSATKMVGAGKMSAAAAEMSAATVEVSAAKVGVSAAVSASVTAAMATTMPPAASRECGAAQNRREHDNCKSHYGF
jgi:hypothetical protein